MPAMKLSGPDWKIEYDESSRKLCFDGIVRLVKGSEVSQFKALLARTLEFQASLVCWDFTNATYIDSTVMQQLYRVLMRLRQRDNIVVRITANDVVPVQQRFIPNLKRFYPKAEIYYI